MPRAGGQAPQRQRFGGDRALHLFDQPGRAYCHRAVLQLLQAQLHAARLGDDGELAPQALDGAFAQAVVRRSAIHREARLARDHVDGAGQRLDAADRRHQFRHRAARALDREHALGGGGERVVAQVHGDRAGMAGHAAHRGREAAETVDRGDHAHRDALGFQHRSLLDVQLGIGMQLLAAARGGIEPGRVEPEGGHRLLHRHAVAIAHAEQRVIESPRDSAAAEQRGPEAHAFLVGEADHLERERQAPAGVLQRVHAFHRRNDAEHAVVLACVAHGIEVRAEHQAGKPRLKALVAPDHVADGVQPRAHARFAHPAEHEFVGGALFFGEVGAREAARELADPRELIATRHDAGRVDHAFDLPRKAQPVKRFSIIAIRA